MLGLLGGFSFALLYAVSALPIARWADTGNRRTVIAFAITVWSVMTVICGLAQSFWQLALARVGVGAAEPGAMPPALSLLADYFPPNRRATAISVLSAGGAAGFFFGVGVGGYIAATYGWRRAFIAAGIPGLALAVIVRFVLAEPRFRVGFPGALCRAEDVRSTLLTLVQKKSFLFALASLSLYSVFSFAATIFLPTFMTRSLHAALAQASVTWGLGFSTATLVGSIAGGWSTDYLGKKTVRWYSWWPAITCTLGAPIFLLSLACNQAKTFVLISCAAQAILSAGIPAAFTVVQAVCGSRRRATAMAAVHLSFNIFGGGFGPLLVGVLSDALAPQLGIESLRYSLMAMIAFLMPAAATFYLSGRSILKEQEA